MTIVNPLVGARLSRRTTTREHILGTSVVDTSDPTKRWVYALADVAITSGIVAATMNASFHLTAATGGAVSAGGTAFAAGDYGWVSTSVPAS